MPQQPIYQHDYTRAMHRSGPDSKTPGKWVPCLAKEECTLKGETPHNNLGVLKETQNWAGRRSQQDVTDEDVSAYKAAVLQGKVEETRRPLESLEDKKKRLGKEKLTTPPVQKPKAEKPAPARTPSFADLKPAVSTVSKPARPASVTATVRQMLLKPYQYDRLLELVESNGLGYRANKQVNGATFGFGKRVVYLSNIEFTGPREKIEYVMRRMNNLTSTDTASIIGFFD